MFLRDHAIQLTLSQQVADNLCTTWARSRSNNLDSHGTSHKTRDVDYALSQHLQILTQGTGGIAEDVNKRDGEKGRGGIITELMFYSSDTQHVCSAHSIDISSNKGSAHPDLSSPFTRPAYLHMGHVLNIHNIRQKETDTDK